MTENTEIRIPDIFQSLYKQARYYVYYGGRGSGKSHTMARYLICLAMQYKLKILCTRELQNSILESVYTLLKDVIATYNLYRYFRIQLTSITCCTGSVFIFKGLEHNVESIKSTEGVDICWVEEADKVSQASWDILLPTIRRPGSRFFITFNPTHDDDPVWTMFVANSMPNSVVQKVNYYDNPFFPDVLREEMENLKASDYEKYLHVWEGELRTISDAQIFKGKYSVEEFSSEGVEAFYHGMDFGFAKDPTAVIKMYVRSANLYIDRESVGHHVELKDMGAMIRDVIGLSEFRRWKIKADCSRPETISFLKNEGFNIEGAKKWPGSVEDGIEYLRSFKKIIIHPRCTSTAIEFRRYCYKVDRRTNLILPIVVDDYNHSIDSIRYGLDDLIKHKLSIYDEGVMY